MASGSTVKCIRCAKPHGSRAHHTHSAVLARMPRPRLQCHTGHAFGAATQAFAQMSNESAPVKDEIVSGATRSHPFAASCRPFLASDGFSALAALLGATCVNNNRTFLRTASDARVHSLTLCVASHFVMLVLLCRCSVGIEFFWRVELADEH